MIAKQRRLVAPIRQHAIMATNLSAKSANKKKIEILYAENVNNLFGFETRLLRCFNLQNDLRSLHKRQEVVDHLPTKTIENSLRNSNKLDLCSERTAYQIKTRTTLKIDRRLRTKYDTGKNE